MSEMELTIRGTPRKRKRYGKNGLTVLVATRAPLAIIEIVKAKADARQVSVAAVIRDALENYCDRAA